MRLLVIEDENRIAQLVQSALGRAGFVADAVATVADCRALLGLVAFDAVILDLGLPDGDGIFLLEEIRRTQKDLPVLILTARDSVEDRVAGLDTGADDYLIKPFALAELVARTKALLRRPGRALGATLEAGNLMLDTVGRGVAIGQRPVLLTRQEIGILEHLMRRLGRVVPKAVLEEKLYGMNDEPESNAIPVHIHHLRRKLSDAGATPQIHTVRGIGYLLTEPNP